MAGKKCWHRPSPVRCQRFYQACRSLNHAGCRNNCICCVFCSPEVLNVMANNSSNSLQQFFCVCVVKECSQCLSLCWCQMLGCCCVAHWSAFRGWVSRVGVVPRMYVPYRQSADASTIILQDFRHFDGLAGIRARGRNPLGPRSSTPNCRRLCTFATASTQGSR